MRQESAKRVLEVAAAGGHNLLMIGPPGSGKSMLAARLPGLLPPLEPEEALEASMVRSLAGDLGEGRLSRRRTFRDPHHSATLQALVGGGRYAKPGEVSLAHHGVLFLDELPEFSRATLEAMRQPLETGRVTVARAAAHVTYPARFQLAAAMNPCRCGHLMEPTRACGRSPRCGADYQGKLSGPLLDRIDLAIDVPAVAAADLALPPPAESSADIAARVAAARARTARSPCRTRSQGQAGCRRSRPRRGPVQRAGAQLVQTRCNAETDGALFGNHCRTRCRGSRAAQSRRRTPRSFRSCLASYSQGRTHPGRPRRIRRRAPPAHRRGAELPPPATTRSAGSVTMPISCMNEVSHPFGISTPCSCTAECRACALLPQASF